MSKLVEHAAYLEEYPADNTLITVVMRMTVPKAMVEPNAAIGYDGAFEEIALEKGWDGTGSAAEYNRQHWIASEQNLLVWRIDRKNVAAKIEEAKANTQAVLAALLPTPPTKPEPE